MTVLSERSGSERDAARVLGLDFARAAAIGGVLVAHATLVQPAAWSPAVAAVVRSGSWGVEIFFALSGYLIGGQLYDALSAGRFSLAGFWRRRWLRTLPAYFVFLALNFVWAHWIAHQPRPSDWRQLLLLHFATVQHGSAGLFPESWSLAVEEWFYLFVPLLLLLGRAAGARLVGAFAGAVAVLAAAAIGHRLSVGLTAITEFDQRTLTISRLDAVALGVAVVCLDRRGGFARAWVRQLAAMVGIGIFGAGAMIGLRWWTADAGQNGGLVWACLFTVMPAAAALTLPALARVQRLGWSRLEALVRLVARLSYSMYLANLLVAWGTNALTPRLHLPLAAALAVFVGATLAVSWASYTWIERPFIRMYRRPTDERALTGRTITRTEQAPACGR